MIHAHHTKRRRNRMSKLEQDSSAIDVNRLSVDTATFVASQQ